MHEALLYRSPQGFADQVSAFVRAGRAAGEPVLAVLPPESQAVAQVALGLAAGEVRYESMAELGRNPCCLLDVYQEWIDMHTGRVRVIGEPVWPGRSYPETIECLRHEALVNTELASAPATLLCPYDAERLDAAAIEGAELTHPRLLDGDGLRRDSTGYGEPLELAKGLRWPQAEAIEPVHEHRFSGDLRSLRHAIARDSIARALRPERRADLVFAINEAATNAVKHGDGVCTARLWSDGERVVSEVSTGSRLRDVFAGRRRPGAEVASGRGLWLINQLCDLVELRSGETGTTLRMHVSGGAA